MKIQYMSDLHLEFAPMQVPPKLGDVLILAGDVHLGTNALYFLEQCSFVFDKVFYILGNHEYYGQDMWKLPGKIRDALAGIDSDGKVQFEPIKNVHLLDNDVISHEGVNFIGTTLWSWAKPDLKYLMNDFRKITYKYPQRYGKFSPEAAINLFMGNKHFLLNSIKPGEKNVVITHHAPSFRMINLHRYDDPIANSGYATEILQDFNAEDIAIWISGHTHAAMDKIISGIHCVSNCRGYVPYEPVENFNPIAMVEV